MVAYSHGCIITYLEICILLIFHTYFLTYLYNCTQALLRNTYTLKYWGKRAAFQRSAFGRSTAGNDVMATIFICLFFPVFFPFFLRCDLFS